MKQKDITRDVMERVIEFERTRIRVFRWLFFTLIGLFGLLLGASLFFTGKQAIEFDAFSLLTLFREDWEIIKEFWQDTLATFWEELPTEWVALLILSILSVGVILLVTRKKRAIIQKKRKELLKYK